MSLDPLLKRQNGCCPRAHTTSTNLLNCSMWQNHNHYAFSSTFSSRCSDMAGFIGLQTVGNDDTSANDFHHNSQFWAPIEGAIDW